MRLSIEEIALVKSKKKSLDDILKTHDGTSMGRIKSKLKEFIKDNAKNRKRQYLYLDENGKELNEKDLTDNGMVHLIRNIGDTDIFTDEELPVDGFHPFTSDDIFNMVYTTDNQEPIYVGDMTGEDLYRSVTIVSPSGETVSLIKNNKFSTEDKKTLLNIEGDFGNAWQDFYITRSKAERERYNELLKTMPDDLTDNEVESFKETIRQEAIDYSKERVGTPENFLKDYGIKNKLSECNVRFHYQKNSNL